MKKKVVFLLLVFLFSFYCHASEDIEIPLIYNKNDSFIMIGETVVPTPKGPTGGYSIAFDAKQKKLWFQYAEKNISTFICVNTNGQTEDTFTIDFGNRSLINGRFFFYDNKALICDLTKEFMRLIVDLETKEYQSIDISKMRYKEISCYYDNKIFFFSESVEKSVMYFDCLTGEIFYAETDLQGYGFMPLVNAYVGLNKKGKIVIQKFDTGEIIETNISGIKGRPLGKVNDRYYMTEKYLYFSKKDRGYSFTHGIQLFLGKFLYDLGKAPIPHKWYRYSLETGEIEKIKTDYPFINLLGVVEE